MKTLGLFLVLASIPAMPQAALAPVGVQQFFDNTGVPLSGGTVTTYIAGTTTKLATYTDATGTVPATNPIVLDAGGFASIWLGSGSYKFVVKRADGTLVSTTDNISSVNAGLTGLANTWTQPQTVGVITAYTASGTVLGAYSTISAGITALTSTGGTLLIGAGNFSESLTLPDNGKCISLKGSGIGITTITVPSATAAGIYKGASSTPFGCSIEDLTINANKQATYGIQAIKGKEWKISRVQVYDSLSDCYQFGQAGSGAEFYELKAISLYCEFTPANWTAGTQPPYGLHLKPTATDSTYFDVVVKNALTAGIEAEGTNNIFFNPHVYGFPLSYATSYSFEDFGSNRWIGFYSDSAGVDAFHFKGNNSVATGGVFYWGDQVSQPTAGIALVDSGVSGLSLTNSVCVNVAPGATPINYVSGFPPSGPTAIYGITGCTNFMNEYMAPANRDLVIGGTVVPNARLFVTTSSDSAIPFAVRAHPNGNMTVPVQEWLDESNLEIAAVDHGGIFASASQTAITSASTIAPTARFFHVTGTTTINTITAPAICTVGTIMCQMTIIPDGLFATGTSGNIAIASTAVVSKALTMTYDPATTRWYPSY